MRNAIAGAPGGTAAHGSKDMPVWGDVWDDVFRFMASNESIAAMRTRNRVTCIELIQVK